MASGDGGICDSLVSSCISHRSELRNWDEIKQDIIAKYPDGGEVNVLIIGKYKAGKSTLINSLFHVEGSPYREYAKEGETNRPTTPTVRPYTLCITKDLTLKLYDSPGFQDGHALTSVYAQSLSEHTPKLHLIIFCTKINDPLRVDDKQVLEAFMSSFNESCWSKMVIAMTHSDQVRPTDPNTPIDAYFSAKVHAKVEELRAHFRTSLQLRPSVVVQLVDRAVPTATAGYLSLPGTADASYKDWRANFWSVCMNAATSEGEELTLLGKALIGKYLSRAREIFCLYAPENPYSQLEQENEAEMDTMLRERF